jgi:hypothetical protein
MESNNIYSPENMEAMKKNFFTDYEITEDLSQLQKSYLDNLVKAKPATPDEARRLIDGYFQPESGI